MRKNGILMHLSSLPSPYGIGSMGKAARDFIDFLADAGQSFWQVLPVCPTGYGDSPYQSFSTFAGNPYFIDLEELRQAGYLEKEEYETVDWESTPGDINYGVLYEKRYPILRLAAERFLKAPPAAYMEFCEENKNWLEDFALFMALKGANQGKTWLEWEPALRSRNPEAVKEAQKLYSEEIAFWRVTQYLFFTQWEQLHAYAGERGIDLIGDLPIYVSLDSVDVWSHPELFQLDDNLRPKEVAGCPPDGFSETGQLWGNPLFDWERMAEDDYAWWTARIGAQCRLFDMLRIDHFRGFESYFAIPYGDTTAKNGHWKKGPGMALFRAVERSIGRQRIIAEDLGFMTDAVKQLLSDSGFPGMRLLQFGFDSRDGGGAYYLPHNYIENSVAYVGTHDNDTAVGWVEHAIPEDVAAAKEYLGLSEEEGYHWGMLRALWMSPAGITIAQAQDLLGLGSECRMNAPSTVGKNWRWRALPGCFDTALAAKVRRKMEMFGRL